jgi:hypothetical protein
MPPNLTGYYRFVSQQNLEDYLQALSNDPTLFCSPSFLLLSSCKVGGLGSWHLT